MRKIFKYPLHGEIRPHLCMIEIPEDFNLLHLGQQGNTICIWADVEPTRLLQIVTFELFATDEDLVPTDVIREYVGTVHLFNDAETYHVYRRSE